ncbi:MAG: choice-of-anchor D domain-containing protein [Deltaproteobacteria bacterium]
MRRVNAISTLLALAAACSCPHRGSSGTQLESKDSTPVAKNLDFGSVPIGQPKTLPLTLSNAGELELDISGATISGPNKADFALAGKLPASIQPGQAAQLPVQFVPGAGGARTATLAIVTNSAAVPTLNVTLTGIGIDVVIAASVSALDFGPVQVGTQRTLPVTLTNKGSTASAPIQLQPVTGPQASEFAWVGQGVSLAPNQSLTLQVSFSPTQTGNAAGQIPYLACAGCAQQSIPLTGVGIDGALTFSPNPVGFTNVPSGTTSTTPVTITDTGSAAVALDSIGIQGGASSPFAVSGLPSSFPGTPIVLAPGQSTSVTVDYTAAGSGDQDELVVVFQPGAIGPTNAFTGAAVAPRTAQDPLYGNETLNPCTLSFKPPSLNFGNAPLNTSIQKSVTLVNQGQAQCQLTQIALDPKSDPSFALVAPPSQLTIAAGGSAQLQAACDVTSAGTPLLRTGAITFQSNDPANANGRIPLTAYLQSSSPYAQGWPKWHMGNTDEGQSEADTSGLMGKVAWKFNVGAPQAGGLLATNSNPTYMNSPVVDTSGMIYELGMDGNLHGLNPDGTEAWKVMLISPASDPHPATPIIAADGSLFVEAGCDSAGSVGNIYHVSGGPTGGKMLHSEPPPKDCRTDPSTGACDTADGFDVCPSLGNTAPLIFDGDDFGQVVTYSVQSGGNFSEANHVVLPFFGERVALAIGADDTSYWCSLNVCFAVNPPAQGFTQVPGWSANGQAISPDAPDTSTAGTSTWVNSDLALDSHHTGWIMAMVAWEDFNAGFLGIGGGTPTGQTELSALDPKDGSIHWTFKMPQFTPPTAVSITDQSYVFSSDIGNGAPAIADDGTVYVGNGDGLYAVDGQTGAVKAGFPFSSSDVDSAPAIGGDGTIFFGTSDGSFYAVFPNGKMRFKISTGGRVSSSPAIGPDGTVFFVSDDGFLYAIQ